MRLARWLLTCLLLLFALAASAQDAGDERSVFGVVEGFWLPDDVCELGAGWERIIFDWAQHQPDGPDDWYTLNVDDRWLEAARNCNREVVALLKHTPAWATDGIPNAGVPRGLYLPVDDPGNLWAGFVRRAAEYYAPRGVNRFIIWNEPDITRDTYGYEFEGTLEDYAQLLRVAYLAARQSNPNALIHIAGTTYWHDVNEGRRLYLDRLLEHITSDPEAVDNGYYFDAVTLHIYFRTDTVYQIVAETRALLERYNLADREIWIDETNASPNLDPQWPVERPRWQITLDQQGAFLAQAAALGLAAGADYIGVYKFFDWSLPSGAESFGIIRADESRRPAFDTWRMVIEQFADVEGGALARNERVNVVRLHRADGQQVLVSWARTVAPVQLQVRGVSEPSQLLDQYGKMMLSRPVNGVMTLALPGAQCHPVDGCPVGGFPTLLVYPAGTITLEEMTADGVFPLQFDEE